MEWLSQIEIYGIPFNDLMIYWIILVGVVAGALNLFAYWDDDCLQEEVYGIVSVVVVIVQSLNILFYAFMCICGYVRFADIFDGGGWGMLVYMVSLVFVTWQHLLSYKYIMLWVSDEAYCTLNIRPTLFTLIPGAILYAVAYLISSPSVPFNITDFWGNISYQNGLVSLLYTLAILLPLLGIIVQCIYYVCRLKNEILLMLITLAVYLLFLPSVLLLVIPSLWVVIIFIVARFLFGSIFSSSSGKSSGSSNSYGGSSSSSGDHYCRDCAWYDSLNERCKNSYAQKTSCASSCVLYEKNN